MAKADISKGSLGRYPSVMHFDTVDKANPDFIAHLPQSGVTSSELMPVLRIHGTSLKKLFPRQSSRLFPLRKKTPAETHTGEFFADTVTYDGENSDVTLLTGRNGKRAYILDGNDVYIPNQHTPNFRTLAGYLSSPEGNNIVMDNSQAAGIAFYGTIASNYKGSNAPDWMGINEALILEKSARDHIPVEVFNPNTNTNVQTESVTNGLNMQQFAREALNIFGAEVVGMNFEPQKGGIALAELRMAMLASVLTGHKLIVRMEEPDMNNINFVRSRAVAEADIEFFRQKFGKRLKMDFYTGSEIRYDELSDKAWEAYKQSREGRKRKHRIKLPTHRGLPRFKKHITLSGSSANAKDIAIRLELTEQMRESGHPIAADTYKANYDGDENAPMSVRMKTMKANRMQELEDMLSATNNIVYAGAGSLSQFGQMTTALLFAAYNRSSVHVLFQKDPRDQYDGATNRTETAKVVMSDALANILSMNEYLKGVSPWMGKRLTVMTDGLSTIVDSFKPSWRFSSRRRTRQDVAHVM